MFPFVFFVYFAVIDNPGYGKTGLKSKVKETT